MLVPIPPADSWTSVVRANRLFAVAQKKFASEDTFIERTVSGNSRNRWPPANKSKFALPEPATTRSRASDNLNRPATGPRLAPTTVRGCQRGDNRLQSWRYLKLLAHGAQQFLGNLAFHTVHSFQ